MSKEPEAFLAHWPEGLETNTQYKVLCDDKGRNGTTWLNVMVANDGDLHVGCYEQEEPDDPASICPSIRVRTRNGGGSNWRTRQALLWLADAIRRDNAENKACGRKVAQ